ncbi:MAG: hypothetical protein E2591_26570 [Achromobacter sp.]|uniref:hypothetical protein n=1 Tax=Achromobacter sp. TaxID=134375 RepID=UPI0012CC5380|nr:hypothetical protein [Achromobacter sp.]MPS81644.1 hypothetical protein [Achromobacter sp.]
MGQAKQRRLAQERGSVLCSEIDLARVAAAVQRICTAASANLGVDCFVQARMAQHVLRCLGLSADLVIGYAAWRVGPGPGDVISHYPAGHTMAGSAAYHAWVRVEDHIFDVTTNTLALKAEMLDALDGGHTSVSWAPTYLWLPMASSRSLQEVTQGLHGGVSSYLPHAALQQFVMNNLEASDGTNEALAWLAYQAPDSRVLGPNTLMAA